MQQTHIYNHFINCDIVNTLLFGDAVEFAKQSEMQRTTRKVTQDCHISG